MATHDITIRAYGPPVSPADQFFQRIKAKAPLPSTESDLLKSIRSALTNSSEGFSGTSFQRTLHLSPEEYGGEEELAWDDHFVVWSSGDVLRRRWSFEKEKERIQWACLGWLLQPGAIMTGQANSAARYTSDKRDNVYPVQSSDRDPFSPFMRARQSKTKFLEPNTVIRCLFVFLRSFCKILYFNGLEYTVSLPFLVRRAWPVFPHGVLIQRSLDRAELEDVGAKTELTLPTLFSITSPFSEPRVVGLSDSIHGGFRRVLPVISGLEDKTSKVSKTFPADEHVLWIADFFTDDIIVTVDPERRKLSVWRHTYMHPSDVPDTSTSSTRVNNTAKPTAINDPDVRRPGGVERPTQPTEAPGPTQPVDILDMQPLQSLPGMPPSLASSATMNTLASADSMSSDWSGSGPRTRRNSLTRNELSKNLNRMQLSQRVDPETFTASNTFGSVRAAFWTEQIHVMDLPEPDANTCRDITFSLFDKRNDGKDDRSYLAICFPHSQNVVLLKLTEFENKSLRVEHAGQFPAIAAVPIRATRDMAWDLLTVRPDNSLIMLTFGLHELHLRLELPGTATGTVGNHNSMAIDEPATTPRVIALEHPVLSAVTLILENGVKRRTAFHFSPHDVWTARSLHLLCNVFPSNDAFGLYKRWLQLWSVHHMRCTPGLEFQCFTQALFEYLDVPGQGEPDVIDIAKSRSPWQALALTKSHSLNSQDMALRNLNVPRISRDAIISIPTKGPHRLHRTTLQALHLLGEECRMLTTHYDNLSVLVPLICRLAIIIRPEWIEHWKRLCPDSVPGWPTSSPSPQYIDDTLPVMAPNIYSDLYKHMTATNPPPAAFMDSILLPPNESSSYSYSRESLWCLRDLFAIYGGMADSSEPSDGRPGSNTRRRAEGAIMQVIKASLGLDYLSCLPLGIAAPIREAARTCQLAPPNDWQAAAFELVGRNDIAEGTFASSDMPFNDGYRSHKDHANPKATRKTYRDIFEETHNVMHSMTSGVTGVELDLKDFTDIRFGQDRRLEEVARILNSSEPPSVKMLERPELGEHDVAKEQQNQVLRTAERTLSLPLGRAMFTYGSVPAVTKEVYSVPKIELSIRVQPQNIVVAPEPGKIPPDSIQWAEFHNGVAAGLRISPSSPNVDSSWIAFNKPTELTSEHAGFLFGLGLNGHLKEMLTWHTFAYLTPKHDLTSIGILLGLAAAHAGSGNRHVTKLLAVHTPALLPAQMGGGGGDLNVPLLTQAAGLAGVGLLYMSTKHRRMAEVALAQMARPDLLQPDLGNEHREAYTIAAALAFGMVMLGRGSAASTGEAKVDVPADVALLSRLRVLIHGEGPSGPSGKPQQPSFDVNLTSPAASVALGLMYLRTNRRDIAEILTLPSTARALAHLPPNFLLYRTLGRALIMWDEIRPTNEWLLAMIPAEIARAMETRNNGGANAASGTAAGDKTFEDADAVELAYYHIIAGCCFAIGLKYAGTAREEAYLLVIGYYDLFSRFSHANTHAFDHKIKRSAIRDGLNLLSLALNMVMAGTGEINCLRRLRYAHGVINTMPTRYGAHVSSHMSLGLLFLGAGRYTLGTSDAAVACMLAAFYPRFAALSSDNRSYLQALRHLWVLAVEPRCLVARDVDTREVVYLPMKIKVKDKDGENSQQQQASSGTIQLISPTLIPSLDRLMSIKVDTPRYWPFLLDIENVPRHREALLRSQTIFVKRRTAFLSYLEDPKGSRSLFVRSGTSTADAATLDFPQQHRENVKTHPASDLQSFITSFSNDIYFIAFADRLCREDEEGGSTEEERMFRAFCHAALLDAIIQDKPQTLQTHLLLYRARLMPHRARNFNLVISDLRNMAEFYGKVYERKLSGRGDGFYRAPLVRESTVNGTLHALDERLRGVMTSTEGASMEMALRRYVFGDAPTPEIDADATDHAEEQSREAMRFLAWYLMRHNVPSARALQALRQLAMKAHEEGGQEAAVPDQMEHLEQGIKLVLHVAGNQMVQPQGTWTMQSFEEILRAWQSGPLAS